MSQVSTCRSPRELETVDLFVSRIVKPEDLAAFGVLHRLSHGWPWMAKESALWKLDETVTKSSTKSCPPAVQSLANPNTPSQPRDDGHHTQAPGDSRRFQEPPRQVLLSRTDLARQISSQWHLICGNTLSHKPTLLPSTCSRAYQRTRNSGNSDKLMNCYLPSSIQFYHFLPCSTMFTL